MYILVCIIISICRFWKLKSKRYVDFKFPILIICTFQNFYSKPFGRFYEFKILVLYRFHLFEHFTISSIVKFLRFLKCTNYRNSRFLRIEYIMLKVYNVQVLCCQTHGTLTIDMGQFASSKIYQILGGNNIEM